MVHRPAATAEPAGVLEMQSLRPLPRPSESECLREGPRNMYFNKISRKSLSILKLGTGLGHWLLTEDAHQKHFGGGAFSVCKHSGPAPRAPETGDLERDLVICK